MDLSELHTRPKGTDKRILKKEAAQKPGESFRLGVAMDEAFCFYYRENLEAMEEAGGILVAVSPLHDKKLPPDLDGLLLGGGYPELYAKDLSENESMRQSIRGAAEAGMPILAECGGFLYLLEELRTEDGRIFPMAGVFPGGSERGKRLGNFGYLTLTAVEEIPFLSKGIAVRGHEFHYWQAEEQGEAAQAQKPAGKREWLCMRSYKNTLAGFPHLYYRSCPDFTEAFAGCCRAYQKRRV